MQHIGRLVPFTIVVGSISLTAMVHDNVADFVFIMIGAAVALGVFWGLRHLFLKSKNGQLDNPRLKD